MKLIIFYFIYFLPLFVQSQNIVKVINITPGENSVTSSLPFDRPTILKWTSKDPINIIYAGLETIKKGQVSNEYKHFAQENSFFQLKNDTKKTSKYEVIDRELRTTLSLNPDGKYELNIIIPPLEPNKFYEIKLLRRPLDSEATLYLDLFSSIGTPDLFSKKLIAINRLKTPFAHEYIAGPDAGKLSIAELQFYYDKHLKSLYEVDLPAAAGDKDKIATINSQIKSALINDAPPSLNAQNDGYIKIFNAIEIGNDLALSTAVTELNKLQAGFVISADASHIGTESIPALKASYNADRDLKALIVKLAAAIADNERLTLKTEISHLIVKNNYPLANDLFTFGQTLSTTTAVLDFDTRTGYTITPDFGYVYYGFQDKFNSMTPYVGFQLEFRYFDKSIPFNLIHPKNFWHYFSFTSGLTLTSFKEEGKRDDFFSGKSLLVGFGLRLSSATRITFGGILFNRENTNPLLDRKKMAITPFIGISIDLKLKSLLNDFYSLTPTKKI